MMNYNCENNTAMVSIGMPVYNGEQYLRQALDSLLIQDYKNYEVIISDNASTDKTQEICLVYASRDKRIRYYRSDQNRGPTWNFNQVFELSSGEYFMWFSDDDYLNPAYISFCLKAFSFSKDIVLVGTACESIDRDTGRILFIDEGFSTVGLTPRRRFMRCNIRLHLQHNFIGGIFCGIYRANILRQFMPMKNIIGGDHILLAELCFRGEFFTVPEPLIAKRNSGVSKSVKNLFVFIGITNPLVIKCPFFSKEVLLQKVIFKTNTLGVVEKIMLSAWTFGKYIQLRIIPLLLNRFPSWIKRPLKRIRKIWRKRF